MLLASPSCIPTNSTEKVIGTLPDINQDEWAYRRSLPNSEWARAGCNMWYLGVNKDASFRKDCGSENEKISFVGQDGQEFLWLTRTGKEIWLEFQYRKQRVDNGGSLRVSPQKKTGIYFSRSLGMTAVFSGVQQIGALEGVGTVGIPNISADGRVIVFKNTHGGGGPSRIRNYVRVLRLGGKPDRIDTHCEWITDPVVSSDGMEITYKAVRDFGDTRLLEVIRKI